MVSEEKLKIAVITSSYTRFPGDIIAPFVRAICENMAALGHEITVVAPYDPAVREKKNDPVREFRFKYIWPDRYHVMGHAKSLEKDVQLRFSSYILLPLFLISAFIKLLKIVREQQSDIIHAHWVIPNGLTAALVSKVQGIPYIISLHGSDIYIANKNRFFQACARWIFRNSSGVTACSLDLKKNAINLGAPKDTALIPWGADPEIFNPKFRTRRIDSQSEADTKVLIASLGRLVSKKGFDKLIDAIPAVYQGHPSIQIIIGGSGLLRDELEKQTRNLKLSNIVNFAGPVPWDQASVFLADADIFILPSIRDKFGNVDGLPTVLLEAMASRVAVIASDIGGVNLVVTNNSNGLLVPPGNVSALSAAINLLIENKELRKKLASNARKSVQTKYNWVEVAKKITALMDKAIA